MLVCYGMNSRYVHTLNIGVLALSFMYLNAVGVILPCTSHKRLDDYTLYCHYTKIKAFE